MPQHSICRQAETCGLAGGDVRTGGDAELWSVRLANWQLPARISHMRSTLEGLQSLVRCSALLRSSPRQDTPHGEAVHRRGIQ